MESRREHPVVQGVIALVAVGALVAGLLAAVAFVGSRVTGLDGSSPVPTSTGRASLYLPKPVQTGKGRAPGPLVTLRPGQSSGGPVERDAHAITLTAAPERTAAMARVDLTGSYPEGEGAILLVQKLQGKTWTNFADITANVSGGRFGTYIQTGTPGANKFRMLDTDTGKTSNVVTVTIG